MSFLQPWALVAAVGVAAAVVVLHFIARQRPRAVRLPTARFVPARSVRAPSRSTRPADLLLLAMRVLAVMLAGAAFAGPVVHPARLSLVRVVALDVSRAVASASVARDSAGRYLGPDDLLVPFDSSARLVGADARDSLATLSPTRAVGSISAALSVAARAATTLGGSADSAELVIVSPFAAEEWDAATPAIRALWGGRARLVRLEASVSHDRPGAIEVSSTVGDPVREAAALVGPVDVVGAVRIDRGDPERADTAWARAPGRVLVRWPAAPPEGWPRRASVDTAGAVVAGGVVAVAPFVRVAAPPATGNRVVARWLDGAPAATQREAGAGCVRDVAIAFPARGDVAIGEGARRLLRALTQPCGGPAAFEPLPDSLLEILRGGTRARSAMALGQLRERARAATTWLLVGAAMLLLAELLVRRRVASAGDVSAPGRAGGGV